MTPSVTSGMGASSTMASTLPLRAFGSRARLVARGVFHPAIFRPEMRTVYPPLAELWFWLAYRLSPSGFAAWKLILLGHELARRRILCRLLQRMNLPPLRALLYAWSPLAVVQLFSGAHLDGLLVPWCLLSLVLAPSRPFCAGGGARRRRRWSVR